LSGKFVNALPEEALMLVFSTHDLAIDTSEDKNLMPVSCFYMKNQEKSEVEEKENTQHREHKRHRLEKLAE
jgi:hypothetical protein